MIDRHELFVHFQSTYRLKTCACTAVLSHFLLGFQLTRTFRAGFGLWIFQADGGLGTGFGLWIPVDPHIFRQDSS